MGLEFKNPNKATEMAQILHNLQEKFVPSTKVEGKTEILDRVFLDGDQLTEERAKNAQLANTLPDTPTERLNGLEMAFADWHLGKKHAYGKTEHNAIDPISSVGVITFTIIY